MLVWFLILLVFGIPVVSQVPLKEPDVHYRHSLWIEGGRGWPWVAASGVQGLASLTLGNLQKDTRFTVRLTFADPDHKESGRRVFDVTLQGKTVLDEFDVVREAGGRMKSVVKQFRDVRTNGKVKIGLSPGMGRMLRCGVELVAEGFPLGDDPEVSR